MQFRKALVRGNGYTCGEATVKMVLSPSVKGSTLKGRNFDPLRQVDGKARAWEAQDGM